MPSKLKHNKYKNTGILFELLVRQITSDVMYNKESKAIAILKKHFGSNSELSKELLLYKTLAESTNIPTAKAGHLVDTVVDASVKLDSNKLLKEKYNFIKAVKNNYNLNDFFKAKIGNYKILAATYMLLEGRKSNTNVSVDEIYNSKITIIEHISSEKSPLTEVEADLSKEDKEIRILAYKILVEKFNTQYSSLSDEQKEVLKEYISNVSNTDKLKKYVNSKLVEIKNKFEQIIPSIQDTVTKIKVQEIYKNISPLPNQHQVKDDHLVTLMRYYELLKELKTNG